MIIDLLKDIKKKGFFHLLTANYFIGFLGLASQLFVAKYLSPAELSDIKVLQSFVAIAAIIGGFGFNTAILKICSEPIDTNRKKELFTLNLIYTIMTISITLLALYVLSIFYNISSSQNVQLWFSTYLLIVPSTVLTALVISYLQALKQIKQMALVQSLFKLVGLFLIIISTYLYGFSGFVWSSVIAAYIALFAIFIFIKSDIKTPLTLKIDRRNFDYAKWSVLANVVGAIAMYLDILILNTFSTNREAFGYYSLATIFLLGLNFVTGTVQSISTPYLSEKSNNKEEFMRVYKKYYALLSKVSIAIGLVAFFVIPYMIELVYGSQYEQAGVFFQILILKYVFWSHFALIGVAIWALGKVKLNFYFSLVTTFFSLIITYIFSVYWNELGAALGQSISYGISLIVIFIFGNITIKNYFNQKKDSHGTTI